MVSDLQTVGTYPDDGATEPFEDTWMSYDLDRFGSFFPNGAGP